MIDGKKHRGVILKPVSEKVVSGPDES
jgi:hypothetical protein